MKPQILQLLLAALLLITQPLHAQVVADGATNTLSNITNTFTGDVTVGTNGPFTLLVLSNNTLLTNSAQGVIGRNVAARSNEVRLVSASARWQMGDSIFIGLNGAANRLTVSNGGVVQARVGDVGITATSSNNVAVVTGAGSLWSNALELVFGFSSAGNQLVISNGGMVRNSIGFLGSDANANNNLAVVTDPGSLWTNGAALNVGINGASGNQLRISNGGRVVNSDGFIGFSATSRSNTVLVTGSGSVWNNLANLVVGNFGSGNALTASNGATVLASNLFVGFNSSATNNRVVVDGGTLRVTNAAGTGVLDVRRGTNVFNAGLIDADRLLLTNAAGVFEFNGGTLITRGAFLNNNAAFNVGNSGSTPAIWHVRAGVSNHFLYGDLFVGRSFSFNQLLITNGALLTNFGSGPIGFDAGANSNAASISGTGSQWRLSDSLFVGSAGSFNRLVVSNGGWVSDSIGVVGRFGNSSNNTALVTGSGSVWSNTVFLYVGINGAANQLVVSAGGAAQNVHGFVGSSATASNNLALITGAGSLWTNRGEMYVGESGSGNQLTISNGATVFAQDRRFIGQNAGSVSNTVLVTGAGSAWNGPNGVYVGNSGANSRLVIADGGVVRGEDSFIGGSVSGSNNVALVTGAGSIWLNYAQLYVGFNSAGNQLVSSNGAQIRNGSGFIGNGASAENNLAVVTGPGTIWSNSFFTYVGVDGRDNHLVISNGGFVTDGFDALIGVNSGADQNKATLSGSGSRWVVNRLFELGHSGDGNDLLIEEGASLVSGKMTIGVLSASDDNRATVSGPGTTWTNLSTLEIGAAGSANALIITDGACVVSSNGNIGTLTSARGNGAGIFGPDSRWLMVGDLYVGSNGPSSILYLDGGGQVVNANGIVGFGSTSINNLAFVSGAAAVWSNRESLYIGHSGSGNRLEVNLGALVQCGSAVIGRNASGGNNEALLTGAGSLWTMPGSLLIGNVLAYL